MRHLLKKLDKKGSRHSEYTSSSAGWFFDVVRVLRKSKTQWQNIEVVETREFGKALLLDGITQLTETLEYQYHEPMAHLPLLAHPCPQRVLVIGGGDGALVREILKHPSIEEIDFVELDAGVVEFCRIYLSELGAQAFEDPRVHLHIEDGRIFATRAHAQNTKYDAIFMDMTDPAGPSLKLYTREVFSIIQSLFADSNSFFIMHTESPDCRPALFARIHATLRSVFSTITPVLSHVRMYGGQWSWAICTNSTLPRDLPKQTLVDRISERNLTELKIISPETWKTLFTLWPEHQTLLAADIKPDTDANISTI